MKIQTVFILCLVQIYSANSLGQMASDPTAEVVKVLKDPHQRSQAISTPEGAKANAMIEDLTGNDPTLNQAMYDTAAKIVPSLVSQTNGDTDKMAKILSAAQTNPEGFFNTLSPDVQKSISEISSSIEAKRGPGSLPPASKKPLIIKTSP